MSTEKIKIPHKKAPTTKNATMKHRNNNKVSKRKIQAKWSRVEREREPKRTPFVQMSSESVLVGVCANTLTTSHASNSIAAHAIIVGAHAWSSRLTGVVVEEPTFPFTFFF